MPDSPQHTWSARRFVRRGLLGAASAFRQINYAQRALFDDVIRPDRVAPPADRPEVTLHWVRTLVGWRLAGTVLDEDEPAGSR